jgi:hypothetical protein
MCVYTCMCVFIYAGVCSIRVIAMAGTVMPFEILLQGRDCYPVVKSLDTFQQLQSQSQQQRAALPKFMSLG